MKRSLATLPLLALLLGLALYFFRRDEAPSGPPPRLPSAPPVPSASHEHRPPASADPKIPASEQEPGMIRFKVTVGGQPVGGVPITVIQSGEDRHMVFKTEADGTQLLRGLPPHEYGIYIDSEDAETRVFLLTEGTKAPGGGKTVLSDAQGHYALKGITPGAFGVRYRHLLYKPHDHMGLLFRKSSDEYQIDVVLELGISFSGQVVDESGTPIGGARVMAVNPDSSGIGTSDPEGKFSVTGLTEVPTNLSASKAGYGRVVLRNLTGNQTNVVFRLPKAGTLLGRLQIDTVPGQTQITVSRYDQELGQVIPEDSKFFAPDLSPGTYWVDVRVEGYEPADRPQVVLASGQISRPVLISMRKKN
jgi:hypothetical protein